MKELAFIGTERGGEVSTDGWRFLIFGIVAITALLVLNYFAKNKFTKPWQRVLRLILLTLGLLVSGLFVLVILWFEGIV